LGIFSWGVSRRPRLRRIADYPNLGGYLEDLYQQPALAETVERDQIKGRYYVRDEGTNATHIVPKGPAVDLREPHAPESDSPTRG
jgi:glutathionyl-hydroquinone reductase